MKNFERLVTYGFTWSDNWELERDQDSIGLNGGRLSRVRKQPFSQDNLRPIKTRIDQNLRKPF